MSDFDPWNATLEEALNQPDAHAPHGPVLRWGAAQEIVQRRAYFEKFPLEGIASCVRAGLLAPDWLVYPFFRQYDKVLNCRVGSWDEAFGSPFPKGTNLARKRQDRVNKSRVSNAVADAINRNPERSIDASFWDEIGLSAGVGKTKAQELHARAVQLGFAIAPSVRKSRLLLGC